MRDGARPRRKAQQARQEAASPDVPGSDALPKEESPAPTKAGSSKRKAGSRTRPEPPDEAAAPNEEGVELLVRVPKEDLAGGPAEVGSGATPGEAVAVTYPVRGDTSEGLFGRLAETPEARNEAAADAVVAADWSAGRVSPRQVDPVRFARLHLRTGLLMRARSEYEALAAEEMLDLEGTLDLAEARWRTADLTGAGLAAAAYVAGGGKATLGLLIAAEAAAHEDRIIDARDYSARAGELGVANLQALFAGIPRRMDWPKSVWEAPTPEADAPLPEASGALGTRVEIVETEAPAVEVEAPVVEPEPVEAIAPAVEVEAPAVETPAVEPAVEPQPVAVEVEDRVVEPESVEVARPRAAEVGRLEPEWAEPAPESAAEAVAPEIAQTAAPVEPSPWELEIAAGRESLESGDALMSALHLAVALRMSPAAAPAVLGVIGGHHDLALELVRGDALRLAGDEPQAAPDAPAPDAPAPDAPAPEAAKPEAAARPEDADSPAIRWE